MGFEPVERRQSEPAGDRRALLGIGDEVKPVSVPNLVELHAMREIAHPIRPSIRSRSLTPLNPSLKRRSASDEKVIAVSASGGSLR